MSTEPLLVSAGAMRFFFSVCAIACLAACMGSYPASISPEGAANPRPLSDIREIKDLNEVNTALVGLPGRVLVVFDIDDTLLTSAQFFGSDKWYDWQQRPDVPPVPCIFDVVSLNYEIATQHPTQPDGPQLVRSIDKEKLYLTARNPLSRGGTMRELNQADYPVHDVGAGEGYLYTWKTERGFVPVSYDQGVFMVSGQDKGLLLLDLLQKQREKYDTIVLVDDGRKNILAMQRALATKSIGYVGLWYTRVSKVVSAEEAREGKEAWLKLQGFLRTLFPERAAQMEAGDCFYQ